MALSLTVGSGTAWRIRLAVSVADEKAVVPPFVLVSTLFPAVPLVRSQARKVMAVPRFAVEPVLCRYRRVLASAASSRALLLLTVPTWLQVVPPLVVYHQVPWLVSVAVSAMPVTAPVSGSVMLAMPLPRPTSCETRVPALTPLVGAALAADCVVSAGDLLASSTGASFTGVTVMAKVRPLTVPPWPSLSEKPKLSLVVSSPLLR